MGTDTPLREYFADLHIHIGRSSAGRPVKITAARDLTFANICHESVRRKGLSMVGVVDCASPVVLADIHALLDSQAMTPLPGGGLLYERELVVIPGVELETQERSGGLSHHVIYLPDMGALQAFSDEIAAHVKNPDLSSQQCHLTAEQLVCAAGALGAICVPAHAFTPHKSVYGSCAARLRDVLSDTALAHVPAIELGLSADSFLADRLTELASFSFLSNSDAHSLPKIGREYNVLRMPEPSFEGLASALWRRSGARVVGNYGLDPRLGKYHRTFCEDCQSIAHGPPPVTRCPECGGAHVTLGVLDRIDQIADLSEPARPAHRPPYKHQVPLSFVRGLGSVMLNALLNRFGTEMAVLHQADEADIAQVVGARIARDIVRAREGTLPLRAGGGGHFGRAVRPGEAEQMSLGV